MLSSIVINQHATLAHTTFARIVGLLPWSAPLIVLRMRETSHRAFEGPA